MSYRTFRALAILALVLAPATARAESSEWNLHVEAALLLPVLDQLEPDAAGRLQGVGGGLWVSADWQLAQPFALEAILGGGYVANVGDHVGALRESEAAIFHGGVGGRLRLLDNQEGYGNEPGGDYLGNAWISAHVGAMAWDGPQLALDVGVGYEWSVIAPVQLGVFARGVFGFFGDNDDVDILLTAGISVGFELAGQVEALDTDGDGLADERESNRWGTSSRNPDTDEDALGDGVEVRTDTDPVRPDTDGDGLLDGAEDADHDGEVDPSETDPRQADTDRGGAPDGFEVGHAGYDPRDASDDDGDHDRVIDHVDQCLGTAPGTEVDERGCAVIRAEVVLEGIEFAFDSAEILPASEPSLLRALQILVDNPDVRVEVGGHTDSEGAVAHNRQLSRERATSVRDWLVAHGIARSRMTIQGYGHTRPAGDNATEEGRQRNRRIEFRRLD